MEDPNVVSGAIDLSRPSSARVYDYYLGGAHNFAVDRALGDQVIRSLPDVRGITHANRAFLRRAVRFLLSVGIRQFLDLGSGIPTLGNVHEVAQSVDPQARVVYTDYDPVAVAHGRALLADNPYAAMVHADLREPARVLTDPVVTGLLDFDQPIGLVMVAVLHYVPGDGLANVIGHYRDALPPGSYVAFSHLTNEDGVDRARLLRRIYRGGDIQLVPRSRQQIAALVAEFELVEPGLVYVPLWRPESVDDVAEPPYRSASYGCVARR